MLSIQKFFGKDDRFFNLLESSAEAGRGSIQKLNRILSAPDQTADVAQFHAAKEADKKITEEINQALVNSFVTQIEKEDIEVLSAALYRIPKTVEKFVERFAISVELVRGEDFGSHITLLDAATNQVVDLVKMLRTLGGGRIHEAKRLNNELQRIEGDADKELLLKLRELYSGKHDPVRVLALRELYELLETVIDRCRDTGNIVTHIVLKNS